MGDKSGVPDAPVENTWSFDNVWPPLVKHGTTLRDERCVYAYKPHHSAGYTLTFALTHLLDEVRSFARMSADMWDAQRRHYGIPADVSLRTVQIGTAEVVAAVLDLTDEMLVGRVPIPQLFNKFALRVRKSVNPAVRVALLSRLGEYYVAVGLAALADVTYMESAPPNAQDWERISRMCSDVREAMHAAIGASDGT